VSEFPRRGSFGGPGIFSSNFQSLGFRKIRNQIENPRIRNGKIADVPARKFSSTISV